MCAQSRQMSYVIVVNRLLCTTMGCTTQINSFGGKVNTSFIDFRLWWILEITLSLLLKIMLPKVQVDLMIRKFLWVLSWKTRRIWFLLLNPMIRNHPLANLMKHQISNHWWIRLQRSHHWRHAPNVRQVLQKTTSRHHHQFRAQFASRRQIRPQILMITAEM